MSSDIHYHHWTARHRRMLQEAGTSLPKMIEIALEVISLMPPDIHMVSGPVSTGGLGNVKDNLTVLRLGVEWLEEAEGRNVFSQIQFEVGMNGYHTEWSKTCKAGDYCWPILNEFYAPLFATRKFRMFHFLHGYEASVGARWEHLQCQKHGIRKRYLPRSLSRELMSVALPALTTRQRP